MSRVARLARLLEIKYGLYSQAISEDRLVQEVKRDVRDVYRNYFSRSARDSMFQYAADLGESKSVELVYKMDKMIKDIDKLSSTKLLKAINELLGLMYQMKNDPDKTVRNAIHDSVPNNTEGQRNTRQRLLTKYERSISMAFPALQKAATKLQLVDPDVAIHGGDLSRQNTRAELSKQQLRDFILGTPAFQQYGVNSFEVMEEFLSDPELKQRLTTLINAVQRGRLPLDASQVQEFAAHIKKMLDQKQQTNQSFFNNNEPLSPPQKEGDEE